uniref:C3H1-type domain-containing protein n=1 Tax=Chromera velia CCMP2878 TaxID=1169474 RepID=A0A0G4HRT9_9ALVE|eukprot:Cvel_8169.t1-p1 / transcript=Cvel_8169.t1 / gene=Cvel_8169 / organism=Chromera_velia_CCMP2878 / gene_product=hypothetical protein / transcript_product=hypothetical protein / location=Cvel_scaffold445:37425-41520(-) / protein_length=894 / sequence_SO=supercontig / SO=protein_coding / is_pseudo=false
MFHAGGGDPPDDRPRSSGDKKDHGKKDKGDDRDSGDQNDEQPKAKSGTRRTGLCHRFFESGSCNQRNCPYAHEFEEAGARYKTVLCMYFSEGRCLLRENCRYAHGIDELRGRGGTHRGGSSAVGGGGSGRHGSRGVSAPPKSASCAPKIGKSGRSPSQTPTVGDHGDAPEILPPPPGRPQGGASDRGRGASSASGYSHSGRRENMQPGWGAASASSSAAAASASGGGFPFPRGRLQSERGPNLGGPPPWRRPPPFNLESQDGQASSSSSSSSSSGAAAALTRPGPQTAQAHGSSHLHFQAPRFPPAAPIFPQAAKFSGMGFHSASADMPRRGIGGHPSGPPNMRQVTPPSGSESSSGFRRLYGPLLEAPRPVPPYSSEMHSAATSPLHPLNSGTNRPTVTDWSPSSDPASAAPASSFAAAFPQPNPGLLAAPAPFSSNGANPSLTPAGGRPHPFLAPYEAGLSPSGRGFTATPGPTPVVPTGRTVISGHPHLQQPLLHSGTRPPRGPVGAPGPPLWTPRGAAAAANFAGRLQASSAFSDPLQGTSSVPPSLLQLQQSGSVHPALAGAQPSAGPPSGGAPTVQRPQPVLGGTGIPIPRYTSQPPPPPLPPLSSGTAPVPPRAPFTVPQDAPAAPMLASESHLPAGSLSGSPSPFGASPSSLEQPGERSASAASSSSSSSAAPAAQAHAQAAAVAQSPVTQQTQQLPEALQWPPPPVPPVFAAGPLIVPTTSGQLLLCYFPGAELGQQAGVQNAGVLGWTPGAAAAAAAVLPNVLPSTEFTQHLQPQQQQQQQQEHPPADEQQHQHQFEHEQQGEDAGSLSCEEAGHSSASGDVIGESAEGQGQIQQGGEGGGATMPSEGGQRNYSEAPETRTEGARDADRDDESGETVLRRSKTM